MGHLGRKGACQTLIQSLPLCGHLMTLTFSEIKLRKNTSLKILKLTERICLFILLYGVY